MLVKVIFEAQYSWTEGLEHEFFVLLFVESNTLALGSQLKNDVGYYYNDKTVSQNKMIVNNKR